MEKEKTIRIPVILSEKQAEEIKGAASALGLTPTAFIRMVALEKVKNG